MPDLPQLGTVKIFSAVLFHFIENKRFVVVQMHTVVVVSEAHCFFFFFFNILLLNFDMFATSSQNSLNKKFQGTQLMFSTLSEIVRYRNCLLTNSIT